MDIIKFLKDWTLPVSMGVGAVVYLVFAYVPQLDRAALFFDPVMEAILPLFMFLVLFVTFCKVDFHKMRPVWWHLWVSIFNLLFVGIVMALILGLNLKDEKLVLMEALLMCIISPCATAAAVVTQKLGGSLEQTTTFTFLSNFITVMLVPLCFPMIEKGADVSFVSAFTKILYQVVILLVVPMLLAYVVKHTMHRLHQKIISIRDLSFYLWGCSLMIVTGTALHHPVCSRSLHRPFLQQGARGRSGLRTKEHRLCHLVGHHLPESLILCGSWMLYSVAKYHQFYRDLAGA